ncbi:hypothetical protein GOBAR_AA34793 [Gossypium barbadense]|uniref:Uncharacterized protein n=1 Tax=Gossypium barbadense TaxID=3634 RepID=A0A2P5W4A4_GOSBA|nr:hypothetical protein GOBAR_AA34793 [Gossypium barbadense]
MSSILLGSYHRDPAPIPPISIRTTRGSIPDTTCPTHSMTYGHVFDLAYFIALAILHQRERHTKGVISIGLHVTHSAVQSSSLTVIGQMSPQAISKDITDDVPPAHEDPPPQPPIHCPVHAAALLSDISECLTQFEEQCFQRFDHIDEFATPLKKVLHDCHVFLDDNTDHHDNLFARHCGCGTQPLPPSKYPPPTSPLL